MFEQLLQEFKNYDAGFRAVKKVWLSTKDDLRKNYKGELYIQKLGEAKQIHDSTLADMKKQGLLVCDAAFSKAREAINEVFIKPVPDDFISSMEVIKLMGKNLSEIEINAYIEKYKGNYAAYRAITSYLNNLGVITIKPLRPEAINEDIDEGERLAIQFFQDFIPDTYRTAIMMVENNPISSLDAELQGIISGDYEDGNEADASNQELKDLVAASLMRDKE